MIVNRKNFKHVMAENVSRFGISEMMHAIKEAVRQSRGQQYLNSREVSEYIKSRYSDDKTTEAALNGLKPTSNDPIKLKRSKIKKTEGSILSDKANYEIFKKQLRRVDNNLFKKTEKMVQDNNEKLSNLTRKMKPLRSGLRRDVYTRLKTASRPKRSAYNVRISKVDPSKTDSETKRWVEAKKKSDSSYCVDSFPNTSEHVFIRTREAKTRLLQDLKLAEQRKQIEMLRTTARDILNKKDLGE